MNMYIFSSSNVPETECHRQDKGASKYRERDRHVSLIFKCDLLATEKHQAYKI